MQTEVATADKGTLTHPKAQIEGSERVPCTSERVSVTASRVRHTHTCVNKGDGATHMCATDKCATHPCVNKRGAVV